MSKEDKSFNCSNEVRAFIDSFNSVEECANECLKREQELLDQYQDYAKCIAALFSDKRYRPIIAMRKIGAIVGVGVPQDEGKSIAIVGLKEGALVAVEHIREELC